LKDRRTGQRENRGRAVWPEKGKKKFEKKKKEGHKKKAKKEKGALGVTRRKRLRSFKGGETNQWKG